jgi:Ser/Thr protein kinase RdoA (MazF antagonist)
MRLVQHARAHGVPTFEILTRSDGRYCVNEPIENTGVSLPIRVFTYIPGVTVKQVCITDQLLFHLGQLVADTTVALKVGRVLGRMSMGRIAGFPSRVL